MELDRDTGREGSRNGTRNTAPHGTLYAGSVSMGPQVYKLLICDGGLLVLPAILLGSARGVVFLWDKATRLARSEVSTTPCQLCPSFPKSEPCPLLDPTILTLISLFQQENQESGCNNNALKTLQLKAGSTPEIRMHESAEPRAHRSPAVQGCHLQLLIF